jgi:hypothetical protein
MGSNGVTSIVALLADSLGSALGYGEAFTRDNDVGAIGRTGDLAAVGAMAQCLFGFHELCSQEREMGTTNLALDIASVLDTGITAEATSLRHDV